MSQSDLNKLRREKDILIDNIFELGAINFENFHPFNYKENISVPFSFSRKDQATLYKTFLGRIYENEIDEKWKVSRTGNTRTTVLSLYSFEDLSNILIGSIIAETSIGYERSSVSSSIGVLYELAVEDYDRAQKLAKKISLCGINSTYPDLENPCVALSQYVYKYSKNEAIVRKMELQLQIAGYIKF
jgi:hypothetical protein